MLNQDIPDYHLIKFNCEHFALFCKLGQRIIDLGSDWLGQIQEILSVPLYPLRLVGLAMTAMEASATQARNARDHRVRERLPVDERFLALEDLHSNNDERVLEKQN